MRSVTYRTANPCKRTYETFSKASSRRTDWLCDSAVKLNVLKPILSSFEKPSILIPGIGHSTLGVELLRNAYDVTLTDLNKEQVSPKNQTLNPVYFDLLGDVPSNLQGAFDCVIDSSVSDVFMQLTSSFEPNVQKAKKVHHSLLSMLKPNGVMVVFSMNNLVWNTIYNKSPYFRQQLRLRPTFHITTTRGRQTKLVSDDVLVLVASNTKYQLEPVTTDKNDALVTEWSDDLPEDWKSQRS